VLRDVAGMLRSFDYARAVALDRALTARPDLQDRLGPALDTWCAETGQAFREGYFEGLGNAPCVPRQREIAEQLIALFQIEKALYELRYELDNRPTWIGIPIAGLLSIVNTLSPG
jgi:maltose alpha-D-glucosyltransferase/alpha-amylase